MGAALKFKQAQVPRQQGEQARLKVVKGPDTGAVFVIHGARATIGRGEDNDIVLTDLKSSRRHAELVMTPSGWTVQDTGSANGIICNGKPTRSGALRTKDTLGLGDTLFEFMSQEAATVMLQSPATTEKQLQAEQAGLAAQKAKVVAMSQFGGLAKNKPRPEQFVGDFGTDRRADAPATKPRNSSLAQTQADPKKLLLIVAALAIGYVLMDGPVKTKMTNFRKAKDTKKQELPPVDAADDMPMVEKTADMFYRAGFREYENGNYLRARTQFETVLQMSPAHTLAKIYLENCNKSLEEEVKRQLYLGHKSECSGKMRESRGHYEAVLRDLFKTQDSPAYTEAKEHLDQLGSIKSKEGCKGG